MPKCPKCSVELKLYSAYPDGNAISYKCAGSCKDEFYVACGGKLLTRKEIIKRRNEEQ